MAVHIEFVVPGPPISNQQRTQSGKTNLVSWKGVIAGAAGSLWGTKPILTEELKTAIINFYDEYKPTADVDNMSKPILDQLQDVVYEDDRQICQAEFSHVSIGSRFVIVGRSKMVLDAIHAGSPFVFVRIEDVVDPFPLPW